MALPWLTRALVRLTDPAVREFLAGDLEEACARVCDEEGAGRAARWCTRQAAAAVLHHPWKPRSRSQRRGDGLMRTLLQDLRYGARMVLRQPAFSAVVIMTLALAIGANTVIFSFANVLLIRPLPIKDTNTIGWLFGVDPHTGGNRELFSIPEFLEYRQSLTSFESLGASTRADVTLTGRGDARRLRTSRVTANLIEMWGLRLELGRGFGAGADAPGAAGEVVISHHYWDRDLGRDPSIVGQTLVLDGRMATIVGVLTPDIEIGNISEVDVWTPLPLLPAAPREERSLRVNGRLKPGITIAQANAEAARVAQLIAAAHPTTNAGWLARVAPSREAMTGADTWPVLTLLALVVGFVLLLACANLANLVLSRATSRRRELAVRTALGASRRRVVRQMLTENAIYGVAGGAAGLLVAQAGLTLIRATGADPFFQLVRIDRAVLLFTAGLALLTPILFAILPALQATRADAGDALKDGGGRVSGGAAARSRSILVVAQLGLAVMLVVLAALLVQAMRNLTNAPLGFDTGRLLTARLQLPEWRYTTDAGIVRYHEQLLARLRANSGIHNAAITDHLPILDSGPQVDVSIAGRATARPSDQPWARTAVVSETFFDTAGIPIVAGRTFTAEDRQGRPPVAVVNRDMARRHWGDPDAAIGAHLTLSAEREPLEIVGVVADVLRPDREGVYPQVYTASAQRPRKSFGLLVRAADPVAIGTVVRGEVRSLDRDVPIYEMSALDRTLNEDLAATRVLGGLFISFALLALVLAASGLYAVVSYAAAQRIREFGVRIALGAMPFDIVAMMLKQTARLVATGLVIGLFGGRVLAIGARTILYGVSASDPLTYAGVAVTLSAVALLAAYVPVRRAMAMDPVSALRLD